MKDIRLDWSKIRLAFSDMDGTLYKGKDDFPGTAEFIGKLRENVDHVYFLSNNSSRAHDYYYDRMNSIGVSLDKSDVLLSSDGLCAFLKKQDITKVYLIGAQALHGVLAANGISHVEVSPEAVIVGFDTELVYEKLRTACLLLQDPKMRYYATHIDNVCPTEVGDIPDAGAIMALIKTATGRDVMGTYGKPDPAMVTHICEKHGVALEECVFLGDRVYTDYAMARNCGAFFIGVLTGEATLDDFANCINTAVFPGVKDVFK